LTDTEMATGAGLGFSSSMLCPPSGGGSASTSLSVGFV